MCALSTTGLGIAYGYLQQGPPGLQQALQGNQLLLSNLLCRMLYLLGVVYGHNIVQL
jgi:hypothetical protein